MRLKFLSAALSVAHFATCAPLPVTVRGQLDVVSADASHGTATLLQTRSRLPSSSVEDPIRIPIDIEPSILPPLTKHRNSKPVPPVTYQIVDEDQPINPPQEFDDENPYEMMDNENLSSFAHPGIPYQQGKATPREINDMHVVVLAASFLGVVVVVEAWNSYKRRRQYMIRLEDTDEKRRLP